MLQGVDFPEIYLTMLSSRFGIEAHATSTERARKNTSFAPEITRRSKRERGLLMLCHRPSCLFITCAVCRWHGLHGRKEAYAYLMYRWPCRAGIRQAKSLAGTIL